MESTSHSAALKSIYKELLEAKPTQNTTSFLSVSCQSNYDVQDRLKAIEKNLQSIQNIKCKTTKKLCLATSAMAIECLQSWFSGKKKKQYEKGFIAFFGEDIHGKKIQYIISQELEGKVTRNIYSLDKNFDVSILEDHINYVEDNNIVLHMDGKVFQFHVMSYNFCEIFSKKLDIQVEKKKKSGGQSSVRFARLAEESRHNAVTLSCEFFLKHAESYLAKTQNIFISGIDEWPQKIHNQLSKSSVQKILAKETFTAANGSFNSLVPLLKENIQDLSSKNKNQVFDKAYEEFQRFPDKYSCGMEVFQELENQNIEILYVIGQENYESVSQYLQSVHKVHFIPDAKTAKSFLMTSLGNILGKKHIVAEGNFYDQQIQEDEKEEDEKEEDEKEADEKEEDEKEEDSF